MTDFNRTVAALMSALIITTVLIFLMPVLLRFSAPAKRDKLGEAVQLADYRKPPPPPPKKEEMKKEVKPKEQVQPKLKSFMPKMNLDTSGLASAPFQFDLGLSTGGEGGVGLSLSAGIFDESRVDAKPVALFRTKPVYPSAAMAKNITGKVRFKMLVDADGMVKTVEILDAQPQGIFEEATIQAVQQWRFQPAKVKGTPVACWCQSSIKYELDMD